MPVVQSGWPVVRIRFDGNISTEQFNDWLNEMSNMLAREQSFTVIASSSEQVQLPEGYRQLQAVWFKASKAALLAHCKGLARIAGSPDELNRLDSASMHKAWPFAYFVTMDEREALNWATQRLALCNA
ncbi:hypothetical protein HG264_04660 [Pseudomonas sp. gcc21]|uniref:hypothetical protein n=1 Tax=Pseudomonas sp. gcc21 TaxID=2726989 RepID=UPI00145253B7|nr:hypothetical protein [Pseudomonas sp. gcc21]QJD58252.1 hypothetical protein HG264_04660 [Pseudomonas sp. gcc21]